MLIIRKKIICPSILNLPIDNMRSEIEQISASGVDIFHIDLMDGFNVPSFGMSIREIDLIRSVTDKPIDCHMMVQQPGRYINLLVEHGVDIIYIHPESEIVPTETLSAIRRLEKSPGIVLNPGLSVGSVSAMLPIVDYVLVMGVNPGFAGRDYMDYITPKFGELANLRAKNGYNFKILLDGGADERVVSMLFHEYGIEGYVVGKQLYFFQEKRTYAESVEYIQRL